MSRYISSNIDLLLPWYSTIDEDYAFKKIVGGFLLAFLLFSVLVAFYPVPEKTREQKETLPPQLARVILEKKELPIQPPPKPKEKKPEPKKPEPKKLEPKKSEPKKSEPKKVEPRKKPKLTQEQKIDKARQEATAQIVQFQDSLAELRDLTIDTADTKNLTRAGENAVKTQRSVIANVSASAKTSSGGIQVSKQSVNTGGAALSGTKNTKIKSSLADTQRKANAQRKTKTTSDGRKLAERSAESIRKVIDINKAALDTTYQRALRKNPALEGAFIVRLIIEPNGQVSSATVIDSELEDPALEKKLLARIRLFNFGAANVAKTPVKYTFNFLPQ